MKKQKLRSERFTEPPDPLFEIFNASLSFDHQLYKHDIKVSIAHATMLGRQKIIPQKDAAAICKGLKKIEKEIESGRFEFDISDEDIHMAIEKRLTKMIGSVAGRLHTARSRNDQVATDLRLYIRDAIDDITHLIRELQKTLVKRAKQHVDSVAVGYTHLQPAQPIRLAHWFLAYYEMLERDFSRFRDTRERLNVLPLGSAALAGTNFRIDRRWVAKKLGFDSISQNSMDAVSDRDFVVEFLFDVSMTATHLSRLAEELIIFTSAEFGVMELSEAFCSGSSIMPQKKNPDAPELIRAKTGRLNGHLIAMLTVLKGLPLAYNKDLQEDKEPVFDAEENITLMLYVASELMKSVKINKAKLKKTAQENFITTVDMADRLTMSGMPFRKAHQVIGKFVRICEEKGLKLSEVTQAQLGKKIDPGVLKVILSFTDPSKSADSKNVPGGASKKSISSRIKQIEREMKKW